MKESGLVTPTPGTFLCVVSDYVSKVKTDEKSFLSLANTLLTGSVSTNEIWYIFNVFSHWPRSCSGILFQIMWAMGGWMREDITYVMSSLIGGGLGHVIWVTYKMDPGKRMPTYLALSLIDWLKYLSYISKIFKCFKDMYLSVVPNIS